MNPSGKTVLLTGATGGLGRTMAMRLADAGARLLLSGRSASRLGQLADQLPGSGHRVEAADLSRPDAASDLASRATDADVLIANAALPATGRLDEFTEAQLGKALTVNLEAPMQLTRALLPGMLERNRGKIVFIGSLAGKVSSPYSSVYNATKFGIRGFAFGLRADLAGTGVDVTLVAPGFVGEAGMFAEAEVASPPGMGTTTPVKVADAVCAAIGGDRAEITVAPVIQKTAAHFGLISPSLSHRLQAGRTGQRTARDLARNQVEKR